MKEFQYFLISLVPDPIRNEQVNVGVVGLFQNKTKAYFLKDPQKIKAIAPDYDTSILFEDFEKMLLSLSARSLTETLSNLNDEFVRIYPSAKGFVNSYAQFEKTMDDLYGRLVKPIIKNMIRAKITKLKTDIKDTFKKRQLLGDELEEKKVVSNYVVSETEALVADFAYRNGVLNIVETIDFRVVHLHNKLKDAALSAIKLDKAKKIDKKTKGTVLYYPPEGDHRNITNQQALLNDYFDQIYNWSDPSQHAEFLRKLEIDLGVSMI